MILFVDYIYLGHTKIEERFYSGEVLDLYGLLQLAHTYQIEPLVHCCTNLISLVATPSDAEQINTLANLYGNEHLRKLAFHLETKKNVAILKV